MEKTLQIQIPKGFKIEDFDINSGIIKFTTESIIERIKSIDDAINELGEDDEDVKALQVIENLSIPKHIISQLQSIIIAKALNEVWVPDWNDSSQYKYFPYFDMESSSAGGFVCNDYGSRGTYAAVGSRLCFKSRELAEYAGKQFIEIHNKYL